MDEKAGADSDFYRGPSALQTISEEKPRKLFTAGQFWAYMSQNCLRPESENEVNPDQRTPINVHCSEKLEENSKKTPGNNP